MARTRIAIIGAGLMGHGIGQVFASAGHPVSLHDPDADALAAARGNIRRILETLDGDTAIAEDITLCSDLADAVAGADLVVEAAPEKLALKQELFRQLDELTPPEVILASNTSVIPITDIAARARDKHRILGMHFWNPPHYVPLVEVVQTAETDIRHVETVMKILDRADMTPVHVRKDIAGFIGNRLQHALKREAIALVADGVCDAETLDIVVREGFGSRLGVLGPLEQSDMIGLQLTLDCHQVLMPHLDRTPHAHPILEQKIAAGETGMAAGKGFRTWTPEEAAAVRQRFLKHMAHRARARRRHRQDTAEGSSTA